VIEAVWRLADLQYDPLDLLQAAEDGVVRPDHRRSRIPGVEGVDDRVAAPVVAQLVDACEMLGVVVQTPAVRHVVIVSDQGDLPDLIRPRNGGDMGGRGRCGLRDGGLPTRKEAAELFFSAGAGPVEG